MAETDVTQTTATTQAPPEKSGGFPPFDTSTFPSQLFWLAITFGFLFVVLWRVAGPRINGAITLRRNTINEAITAAHKAREDADVASSAYQSALAAARARAQALAEQTRQTMNAEIAKAKAEADATAAKAMHDADARITATRTEARGHVANAARDAAVAIVQRLTGETVSPEDAAKAVGV
jgi:F-type H+-transporting ATPase subunit b